MTYITKVRFVEAFRWQGQLYTEIPTWAQDLALAAPNGSAFYCYTRHGPVRANHGDWLILGDKEIYPCTDEEFKRRYEEVNANINSAEEFKEHGLSCGHTSYAQCDVTCAR